MTIQSRTFPNTVQDITITGAESITIGPDAIFSLHHLERLDIKSASNLLIKPDGLRLQANNQLRKFSVDEVNSVNIHASAFSGSWNSQTQVRVNGVQQLRVQQNGVAHQSVSVGPSLKLSRVNLLDLSSGAIMAPIRELYVWNVHMNECPRNSFGGNVGRLVLNHTSINVAKTGCVRAEGSGMEALSIHSSSITSVQKWAFSGKIGAVLISNTTVNSIKQNGFKIQVDNMEVSHTEIEELNSNGLDVTSKNNITVNNVRVGSLKRHALQGLKIDQSSGASASLVNIRSLYVQGEAEDGSLAFANCTPVYIGYIDVVRPTLKVCPTGRWTRKLVGVSRSDRLTNPHFQVYQQLARGFPCTDDKYFPATEANVTDQECPDVSNLKPGGGGGEPTHDAGGANKPVTGHAAGGAGRTVPDLGERGSEREGSPHGSTAGPGEPTGAPESSGPSGGRGGSSDAAGHSPLFLGLGLGAALALVAVTGCLLFCCLRRRAARLTHGENGQKTCRKERQRGEPDRSGTGDWPTQTGQEHTDTTAARRPPPELCDYAEPLSVAPAEGDYAEIPWPDATDAPAPVTGGQPTGYEHAEIPCRSVDAAASAPATGGQPTGYEYAEIPCRSAAAAAAATGGQTTGYEYAEIPCRSADAAAAATGGRTTGHEYAEIPCPAAATPAPATGGQETEHPQYAAVCPSSRVAPDVAQSTADDQEDSESVAPPLPPATAEMTQMVHGMTENVLYAPAQELTAMRAWKKA